MLTGTPPRVWGKLTVCPDLLAATGNTPTRVGKAGADNDGVFCHGKHPHACGESSIAQSPASSWSETPPRVWGKLRAAAVRGNNLGNTPTRMGKAFAGADFYTTN